MKKLPPIAKIPIHNSKNRGVIEYLLEDSPNRNKILQRIKEKTRKQFLLDLEEKVPLKVAASATKTEIRNYITTLGIDRPTRKLVKRYFRRARTVLFGVKYTFKTVYGEEHKPKNKRFTYNEYIQSSVWSKRKNLYYREIGRKCAACGNSVKIHLHHMIYTKFDGTEPNKNLVALCEEHHNQYHNTYGTSGNMKATTYEFIENVRAGITTTHCG